MGIRPAVTPGKEAALSFHRVVVLQDFTQGDREFFKGEDLKVGKRLEDDLHPEHALRLMSEGIVAAVEGGGVIPTVEIAEAPGGMIPTSSRPRRRGRRRVEQ